MTGTLTPLQLYEVAENIEYITMALCESLRMFASTPDTNRECNKTCAINDQLVIPGRIGISVPLACVHLNPQYWSDPSRFDPERFREHSYSKFTYLPFGEEPRHCIGKCLALRITKMNSVTICMLKEFQFT